MCVLVYAHVACLCVCMCSCIRWRMYACVHMLRGRICLCFYAWSRMRTHARWCLCVVHVLIYIGSCVLVYVCLCSLVYVLVACIGVRRCVCVHVLIRVAYACVHAFMYVYNVHVLRAYVCVHVLMWVDSFVLVYVCCVHVYVFDVIVCACRIDVLQCCIASDWVLSIV